MSIIINKAWKGKKDGAEVTYSGDDYVIGSTAFATVEAAAAKGYVSDLVIVDKKLTSPVTADSVKTNIRSAATEIFAAAVDDKTSKDETTNTKTLKFTAKAGGKATAKANIDLDGFATVEVDRKDDTDTVSTSKIKGGSQKRNVSKKTVTKTSSNKTTETTDLKFDVTSNATGSAKLSNGKFAVGGVENAAEETLTADVLAGINALSGITSVTEPAAAGYEKLTLSGATVDGNVYGGKKTVKASRSSKKEDNVTVSEKASVSMSTSASGTLEVKDQSAATGTFSGYGTVKVTGAKGKTTTQTGDIDSQAFTGSQTISGSYKADSSVSRSEKSSSKYSSKANVTVKTNAKTGAISGASKVTVEGADSEIGQVTGGNSNWSENESLSVKASKTENKLTYNESSNGSSSVAGSLTAKDQATTFGSDGIQTVTLTDVVKAGGIAGYDEYGNPTYAAYSASAGSYSDKYSQTSIVSSVEDLEHLSNYYDENGDLVLDRTESFSTSSSSNDKTTVSGSKFDFNTKKLAAADTFDVRGFKQVKLTNNSTVTSEDTPAVTSAVMANVSVSNTNTTDNSSTTEKFTKDKSYSSKETSKYTSTPTGSVTAENNVAVDVADVESLKVTGKLTDKKALDTVKGNASASGSFGSKYSRNRTSTVNATQKKDTVQITQKSTSDSKNTATGKLTATYATLGSFYDVKTATLTDSVAAGSIVGESDYTSKSNRNYTWTEDGTIAAGGYETPAITDVDKLSKFEETSSSTDKYNATLTADFSKLATVTDAAAIAGEGTQTRVLDSIEEFGKVAITKADSVGTISGSRNSSISDSLKRTVSATSRSTTEKHSDKETADAAIVVTGTTDNKTKIADLGGYAGSIVLSDAYVTTGTTTIYGNDMAETRNITESVSYDKDGDLKSAKLTVKEISSKSTATGAFTATYSYAKDAAADAAAANKANVAGFVSVSVTDGDMGNASSGNSYGAGTNYVPVTGFSDFWANAAGADTRTLTGNLTGSYSQKGYAITADWTATYGTQVTGTYTQSSDKFDLEAGAISNYSTVDLKNVSFGSVTNSESDTTRKIAYVTNSDGDVTTNTDVETSSSIAIGTLNAEYTLKEGTGEAAVQKYGKISGDISKVKEVKLTNYNFASDAVAGFSITGGAEKTVTDKNESRTTYSFNGAVSGSNVTLKNVSVIGDEKTFAISGYDVVAMNNVTAAILSVDGSSRTTVYDSELNANKITDANSTSFTMDDTSEVAYITSIAGYSTVAVAGSFGQHIEEINSFTQAYSAAAKSQVSTLGGTVALNGETSVENIDGAYKVTTKGDEKEEIVIDAINAAGADSSHNFELEANAQTTVNAITGTAQDDKLSFLKEAYESDNTGVISDLTLATEAVGSGKISILNTALGEGTDTVTLGENAVVDFFYDGNTRFASDVQTIAAEIKSAGIDNISGKAGSYIRVAVETAMADTFDADLKAALGTDFVTGNVTFIAVPNPKKYNAIYEVNAKSRSSLNGTSNNDWLEINQGVSQDYVAGKVRMYNGDDVLSFRNEVTVVNDVITAVAARDYTWNITSVIDFGEGIDWLTTYQYDSSQLETNTSIKKIMENVPQDPTDTKIFTGAEDEAGNALTIDTVANTVYLRDDNAKFANSDALLAEFKTWGLENIKGNFNVETASGKSMTLVGVGASYEDETGAAAEIGKEDALHTYGYDANFGFVTSDSTLMLTVPGMTVEDLTGYNVVNFGSDKQVASDSTNAITKAIYGAYAQSATVYEGAEFTITGETVTVNTGAVSVKGDGVTATVNGDELTLDAGVAAVTDGTINKVYFQKATTEPAVPEISVQASGITHASKNTTTATAAGGNCDFTIKGTASFAAGKITFNNKVAETVLKADYEDSIYTVDTTGATASTNYIVTLDGYTGSIVTGLGKITASGDNGVKATFNAKEKDISDFTAGTLAFSEGNGITSVSNGNGNVAVDSNPGAITQAVAATTGESATPLTVTVAQNKMFTIGGNAKVNAGNLAVSKADPSSMDNVMASVADSTLTLKYGSVAIDATGEITVTFDKADPAADVSISGTGITAADFATGAVTAATITGVTNYLGTLTLPDSVTITFSGYGNGAANATINGTEITSFSVGQETTTPLADIDAATAEGAFHKITFADGYSVEDTTADAKGITSATVTHAGEHSAIVGDGTFGITGNDVGISNSVAGVKNAVTGKSTVTFGGDAHNEITLGKNELSDTAASIDEITGASQITLEDFGTVITGTAALASATNNSTGASVTTDTLTGLEGYKGALTVDDSAIVVDTANGTTATFASDGEFVTDITQGFLEGAFDKALGVYAQNDSSMLTGAISKVEYTAASDPDPEVKSVRFAQPLEAPYNIGLDNATAQVKNSDNLVLFTAAGATGTVKRDATEILALSAGTVTAATGHFFSTAMLDDSNYVSSTDGITSATTAGGEITAAVTGAFSITGADAKAAYMTASAKGAGIAGTFSGTAEISVNLTGTGSATLAGVEVVSFNGTTDKVTFAVAPASVKTSDVSDKTVYVLDKEFTLSGDAAAQYIAEAGGGRVSGDGVNAKFDSVNSVTLLGGTATLSDVTCLKLHDANIGILLADSITAATYTDNTGSNDVAKATFESLSEGFTGCNGVDYTFTATGDTIGTTSDEYVTFCNGNDTLTTSADTLGIDYLYFGDGTDTLKLTGNATISGSYDTQAEFVDAFQAMYVESFTADTTIQVNVDCIESGFTNSNALKEAIGAGVVSTNITFVHA